MALPNGCSINTVHSDDCKDSEPLIENHAAPPKCCSARFNLAILMFLGISVTYGLRVNLTVAMVAMVNSTVPKPVLNTSVFHECPLPSGKDNTSDTFPQLEGVPQFSWDSETQGWLLGAFYLGYMINQIPGGYLAGHYGGSIFVGLSVVITSALSLLTPLAAQWGVRWLFALRVLEGCSEGVVLPAFMAMWARWAPPLERSCLLNLSMSWFGGYLSLPLNGFICQTLGWPAVFYLSGGAGCLWTIFWFIFVSDDPRTHRHISKEERDYIINSVGPQGTPHGWSLPFLSMMLSIPLWANILCQMFSMWAWTSVYLFLPIYMNNILQFDLESNSFLSALPSLVGGFFSSLFGIIADSLIERRVFSVTVVRKIFTVAGMLLPAACITAVSYISCDHTLTVIFLILSSLTGALCMSGVCINHMDIAPRYAAFLYAILNTLQTIPTAIAPIVTGYLTEDHTLAGWRKVFWLSAGTNVIGGLIFMLFGSGEVQPWAVTEEERAEAERNDRRTMTL